MPCEFHPTLAFGFSIFEGKERLHQLFIGTDGSLDWRPVPYLPIGEKVKRSDAIAGFVPANEEEQE